jgi:NADH:ubiquinone reductase (H+-translocating)
VTVGAGFAGLRVAKALFREPVDVISTDRRNHRTFQPLLYQELGVLSAGDIAQPLRTALRETKNIQILHDEVTRIDPDIERINYWQRLFRSIRVPRHRFRGHTLLLRK